MNRRKNPAFMQSARQHSEHGTQVSESALKQARKTGQLNLSSRSLEVRHNISCICQFAVHKVTEGVSGQQGISGHSPSFRSLGAVF